MISEDRSRLAAQAFVYGFPLVFGLQQVDRFIREGLSTIPPTPLNTFGHATELANETSTFVSVNNDTVYSFAPLDLSGGPLRLDVPDTAGRYYVLQFVDAWTNNFAYVGKRATGTLPGSFFLIPPGWDGEIPEDTQPIEFPTDIAVIVGRFACDGVADLPVVAELQSKLVLSAVPGDAPATGLPVAVSDVPESIAFFEQMRVWMKRYPPPAGDFEYQSRFAPLGLFGDEGTFVEADESLIADLKQGLADGKEWLESTLKSGAGEQRNGWALTFHMFDYNIDFFGVGVLDEPQWKIHDRESVYPARTIAARVALWGNHGYEASYPMTYVDDKGDQLNGSNRYRLTFETPPPVDAFWSVTMYSMPDFFLAANPIDRFSVGDRTPGIVYGKDGSISITIQHDEPDDETERANWLPAPKGDFRPALRLYMPRDEVFSGGWEIPAIERV